MNKITFCNDNVSYLFALVKTGETEHCSSVLTIDPEARGFHRLIMIIKIGCMESELSLVQYFSLSSSVPETLIGYTCGTGWNLNTTRSISCPIINFFFRIFLSGERHSSPTFTSDQPAWTLCLFQRQCTVRPAHHSRA